MQWMRMAAGRSRARSVTGDTAAFLLVSLVVGVAVGIAAALLIISLEGVQAFFEKVETWSGTGRAAVFVSVPAGLLVAWWIGHRFAPEVIGDGVPEATAALAVHAGYLPSRSILLKIAATAATLGGGGSAGREGPIVQVGAAIGSFVARRSRLGEDQIRSLVAAGAGAAIGASFNAPIAGMLFAVEVILGSFASRHLSSVVVASVAAAVTSKSLVGEELSLRAFPYGLGDPRELLLYAGLGLVIVPVAWLFLSAIDRSELLADRFLGESWLRPVAIGTVIAAVGFFEPRILGTGQELTSEVLQLQTSDTFLWTTLLALALLKIIATAGTLSSKASGGAFFPSLFIGAAVGAGFASLIAPMWGITALRPGAFAVVGMAATFAAVARAPLTSILIVFEITGLEYGLVLPLMLAATLATAIVDRIHPESVYTMPLARRGIRLVKGTEGDLLDNVLVGEVMTTDPQLIEPSMTLRAVQDQLDAERHHGLPVVDRGRLVGIVTVSDIARSGGPSDEMTAAGAMTPRPITVTPQTPVSVALERMAALGVGRLPVVAEDDPGAVVGMFRRESAVQAYHVGLAATTGDRLAVERFRQRTDPGASFFDFRIPPGSTVDGRLIREVSWPEGCTLVSVRRHRLVMVPDGNTMLAHGDVITAFGTSGGRRRLIERLNAGADDPTAEITLPDPPGG